MANDTTRYRELWELSQALEDALGAQRFFAKLDDAAAQDRITAADVHSLRQAALSTLAAATQSDPVEAESIILEFLVPECVGEPEDASPQISIAASRMRELLREWIDKYPEDQRLILLNNVIEVICESVNGEKPRPAVWTLSVLGLRSPKVMDNLWGLAAHDNEDGDVALSAIAGMGVSSEDRQKLLNEATNRLRTRQNNALDFAVQEMPDPAYVDLLSPRLNSEDPSFLVGHLLSKIAESFPRDEELQSRIWSTLRNAAAAKAERKTSLIYAGNVGPDCDTGDVVMTFGVWIPEYTNENVRWVVYVRLEDCIRPVQLAGWDKLRSQELEDTLRDDAVRNTAATGQWITTSHRIKEAAWHTAISAGFKGVAGWLGSAVENEVNPYAQHAVMEIAACLSIPEIPEQLARIIRREQSIEVTGDQSGVFPFLGAAEVAHSAASSQSLDLLLDSGLTYDGYVLRSTVEAVGDVACWLIRHGDETVTETLCEMCRPSHPPRARSLAIGGLREVASRGMLPSTLLPALLSSAEDETLYTHLRARSIEAIGLLPRTAVDKADAERLIKLLPSHIDEEVTPAICTSIVRHGLWSEYAEILLDRLQFRTEQNRVVIDRPSAVKEWQAHVLSLLFIEAPSQFESAAAELVRGGSAGPVHQLLRFIASGRDARANSKLIESIAERIGKIQTLRTSELFLFDSLSRLVPDMASVAKWEEQWTGWMPDARAALADTLGGKNVRTENAVRLLKNLLSDASYAVRRAAARAMAKLDRVVLEGICVGWTRSGRTDLRKRAAEASGWLAEPDVDPGTIAVLNQLLVDTERQVREAAKQSLVDSRRRQWAFHYLGMLQQPATEANEFVFRRYAYGRALGHLADDTILQSVGTMIQNYELAPNIRHWFAQLLKEAEKNWAKTTKKWPQPWLPWSGDIEELDGAVIDGDLEKKVHFSFWYRHRVTPTDPADWGGAFWPTEPTNHWLGVDIGSKLRISVPGRPEARILTTSWNTDGSTIFHGTGAVSTCGIQLSSWLLS